MGCHWQVKAAIAWLDFQVVSAAYRFSAAHTAQVPMTQPSESKIRDLYREISEYLATTALTWSSV
jgi:hypothetical protein